MSAPAVEVGGRTLRVGETRYPVLLPTARDPRLHLAAVIVSLQVLGQTAFAFDLSIAQILVALLTCALLEVTIAFRRRRVILWPASALLTGNGVAFVLRVPGTEHGDWWSMRGWWIFAGTAAVALLSKHVVRVGGGHVFNPSNIGLVLCFAVLGPELADPLPLWWGPMSPWLGLALTIIVAGGLAILSRLRLVGMAIAFWLAFALGAALLAVSGHAMTASWHVGPVTGFELWRVLVFSPEILVFLFFMITDPKTIPSTGPARRAFAIVVALLAVVLIAPFSSEFATKLAVLAALTVVCAARVLTPVVTSSAARRLHRGVPSGRLAVGVATVACAAAFVGVVVLLGPSSTPAPLAATPASASGPLPAVTIEPSSSVSSVLDEPTAEDAVRALLAALRVEEEALRNRSLERAADGADGALLASVWKQIRDAGIGTLRVPVFDVRSALVRLEPGRQQGQPIIVATLDGTVEVESFEGSPPRLVRRDPPVPFTRAFELARANGRYVLVGSREGTGPGLVVSSAGKSMSAPPAGDTRVLAGVHLTDVADSVGLRFRHGAFRFGVTADPTAMMGGGLCWLDADGDGWLDLFVVNSWAESDAARYKAEGGLPRAALFHNVGGRFEDVSRQSGADLALRGSGCVAADFDADGDTDVYVSGAGYSTETRNYHALLLNNGDGTFVEGARAAGLDAPGWYAGAAVGDVDGDGLPDLYVAGYTDVNAAIAGSQAGFPNNHRAVPDLLYLNEGRDRTGHVHFREVGHQAGLERGRHDHALGATLDDINGDGKLDLVVANDGDPNRLYLNVPWPGGAAADPLGLGFRLVDEAAKLGVADPNAGMGVAVADYSLDGLPDLFVTNSRRQLHAAFRSAGKRRGVVAFADARPEVTTALGMSLTGWGVTWLDLDLDGDLELALANGVVPIRDLAEDARPAQVLASPQRGPGTRGFVDASAGVGLTSVPPVNGRGLAAADFDNDGDLDLALGSIGGPLVLLRTSGARGHWIEVALGSFAPGATVTAVLPDGTRLVRRSRAGSSYLSSEDPRLHFGLGDQGTVAELVVRWPDGRVTRLHDIRADRVVEIDR